MTIFTLPAYNPDAARANLEQIYAQWQARLDAAEHAPLYIHTATRSHIAVRTLFGIEALCGHASVRIVTGQPSAHRVGFTPERELCCYCVEAQR